MFRTTVALVLLLTALPSPALAQETRPIVFDVLLPAAATLEIDGFMTKSTGETRSFETPAVEVGKNYSYTLKANDGKRQIVKTVLLKTAGAARIVFDLRQDFAGPMPKPMPKDGGEEKKPKVEKPHGPRSPGFVSYIDDGRLWVFREGSKELAAYEKDGDLEKHVSRIKAGPKGMTIKGPDNETIDAYMKALPK